MPRVLFGTGAMHSSYIAKELVDKYKQSMSSRIRKVSGEVTLGDGNTRVKVSERVTLPLEFTDWKGKSYVAMVDLCVWEMPKLDAIIGLPDIVKSYLHFLVDMLEMARDFPAEKERYEPVFSLEERYSDVIMPWIIQ